MQYGEQKQAVRRVSDAQTVRLGQRLITKRAQRLVPDQLGPCGRHSFGKADAVLGFRRQIGIGLNLADEPAQSFQMGLVLVSI